MNRDQFVLNYQEMIASKAHQLLDYDKSKTKKCTKQIANVKKDKYSCIYIPYFEVEVDQYTSLDLNSINLKSLCVNFIKALSNNMLDVIKIARDSHRSDIYKNNPN